MLIIVIMTVLLIGGTAAMCVMVPLPKKPYWGTDEQLSPHPPMTAEQLAALQPGDLVVTTARPGMNELALYATPPAIGTFPVTMSKQPPESVPKKHGIDIIVLANHTVYEADTGFELFDGPTMICDPRLKR